jgi:hypothetical protein
VSPDTETYAFPKGPVCPDPDLCGNACALHEPEEAVAEREAARAAAQRRLALLEPSAVALTVEEDPAKEDAFWRAHHAAADADREAMATIDAWIERVALAAHRLHAATAPDITLLAEDLSVETHAFIAVHPEDLAAMRRAHSATPTDGPLKLWGLSVVADEHVPARTARLRYDVEVPL